MAGLFIWAACNSPISLSAPKEDSDLLLQWMVALSLLKVVRCWDFFTPMDGRLVIKEGSLVLIFC